MTEHEFGFEIDKSRTPTRYGNLYAWPTCSCGWKEEHSFRLRKDGKPTSVMRRYHNWHVAEVTTPAPDHMPALVAIVTYTRVEHEVWVYHITHDIPALSSNSQNKWVEHYRDTWVRRYPWLVLIKKSNGMLLYCGYSTYEEAVIGGNSYAQKQHSKGLEVTFAKEMEAVPAALAPIEANIRNLVQKHASAQSIENLRAGVAAMNEAIDKTKILHEMKAELEERLRKQMEI